MGVFITNGENAESDTLCVHCEVCVCVCLLLVNPRGGKPPALTSEAGSPGFPRHTAVVCGFSFNFYLLFDDDDVCATSESESTREKRWVLLAWHFI